MSETRWHKLNEIFQNALGLEAAAQGEFLQKACAGDADLRKEIDGLLAANARVAAQKFLETDAFSAGARILARDEMPIENMRLGNYKILKEIGRGGMGAVYLAERGDFRQQVALKLIKRGMDTDEIVRRFEREREVLASLNHPHIARLLDGGVGGDGLPYFVMEYVEGVPVTTFCDRQKLGIEERLQLFRKICSAVSYIHQHLVVHRDIKPSNILVNADGEPKLLSTLR